jgi:hypothetical protein
MYCGSQRFRRLSISDHTIEHTQCRPYYITTIFAAQCCPIFSTIDGHTNHESDKRSYSCPNCKSYRVSNLDPDWKSYRVSNLGPDKCPNYDGCNPTAYHFSFWDSIFGALHFGSNSYI